eukprot:NODE_707_length_1694_cov_40.309509_g697_i0.p1 GENE.NODE_707_length_1694_cov_40.309509_g697_i0~~NODE_707_length_1694_cov_40.309509_g697_i0.p1  ORF type:complete len:464 (-),score=115.04 NODE_707_length_1694_cov_40.309509_g697_i0:89-1480(-)
METVRRFFSPAAGSSSSTSSSARRRGAEEDRPDRRGSSSRGEDYELEDTSAAAAAADDDDGDAGRHQPARLWQWAGRHAARQKQTLRSRRQELMQRLATHRRIAGNLDELEAGRHVFARQFTKVPTLGSRQASAASAAGDGRRADRRGSRDSDEADRRGRGSASLLTSVMTEEDMSELAARVAASGDKGVGEAIAQLVAAQTEHTTLFESLRVSVADLNRQAQKNAESAAESYNASRQVKLTVMSVLPMCVYVLTIAVNVVEEWGIEYCKFGDHALKVTAVVLAGAAALLLAVMGGMERVLRDGNEVLQKKESLTLGVLLFLSQIAMLLALQHLGPTLKIVTIGMSLAGIVLAVFTAVTLDVRVGENGCCGRGTFWWWFTMVPPIVIFALQIFVLATSETVHQIEPVSGAVVERVLRWSRCIDTPVSSLLQQTVVGDQALDFVSKSTTCCYSNALFDLLFDKV